MIQEDSPSTDTPSEPSSSDTTEKSVQEVQQTTDATKKEPETQKTDEKPEASPSEEKSKADEPGESLPLESVTELTGEEKIWGALSYISFLCILPLILKRKSAFCQFHAKQGLVMAIIFTLLKFFWVIRFLIPFLGLIELIIIIVAAVQAYTGRWWKIPGIYNLSQKVTL